MYGQERQVGYYAIIPSEVRYCESLNANAKLLYGEITALTNKYGYCWATNKYFSELYGVAENTITRWLKDLRENGFIYTEIIKDTETKRVKQRRIYIVKSHPSKMIGGVESHPSEMVDGLFPPNPDIPTDTEKVSHPSKMVDGQNLVEASEINKQSAFEPPIKNVGDNNTMNNTSINNTIRDFDEKEEKVDPEPKKEKRKKETVISIINNFCLDNLELKEALLDFKEMRELSKAPLSPRGMKLNITELKKLSKNSKTQIEIINQSIMNGWKGFYGLKDKQQGGISDDELQQYECFRAL